MKVRLDILFLLAIAMTGAGTQPVLPQSSGIRLEGRVLRLGTSEPIPNAEIFLVGKNPNLPNTVTTSTVVLAAQLLQAAAKAETDSVRWLMESTAAGFVKDLGVPPDLLRPTSTAMVMSDSMGNFRFSELAAGPYSLSVSKEGFFAPSADGYTAPRIYKNFRIESTARTVAMDVLMVQGGSISGHLLDSSGRAIADVIVEANERSYLAGKMAFTLKSSESIDSRGNFRFSGLLPGEYFLSVRPTAANSINRAGRVPVLTYYPGVSEPSAAVPVIVKDGAEVSGIAIDLANRLSTSQTPTFNISGFTVNSSPPNPGNVVDRSVSTFYLVPVVPNFVDDTPLEFQNAIPVESRSNGEFEIRNVPPGRYELYPLFRAIQSVQPVRSRVYTSRNSVELRDANLTNLQIMVNPGATLRAEVVAPAPNEWLKFNVLSLGLRVIDSMPRTFAAVPRQFDSTGRLTLENMPEARYALSLTGLRDNAYVSDVRQNGRSIFDDGFLLETQSNPVQILVNRDGGTVSGRVRIPRGSTQDVTVVLVPPLARRKNVSLFKSIPIDEDGGFSIRGVAPGTYTLVFLENRPAGEPWLNTDFMAKYEGRGRSIEIKAGSAIQLDSIDR
jgi:hypothetical protein